MPSYRRVMSTVVSGLSGLEFVGVEPLKVIPKSESPANLGQDAAVGSVRVRQHYETHTPIWLFQPPLIRFAFSTLAMELLCE